MFTATGFKFGADNLLGTWLKSLADGITVHDVTGPDIEALHSVQQRESGKNIHDIEEEAIVDHDIHEVHVHDNSCQM